MTIGSAIVAGGLWWGSNKTEQSQSTSSTHPGPGASPARSGRPACPALPALRPPWSHSGREVRRGQVHRFTTVIPAELHSEARPCVARRSCPCGQRSACWRITPHAGRSSTLVSLTPVCSCLTVSAVAFLHYPFAESLAGVWLPFRGVRGVAFEHKGLGFGVFSP